MILIRRGLPLLQISEIGCELGLAIPEDVGHLYPAARIGVLPSSGFGTEIQNPQYSLNSFFERRKYSLCERYYLTAPIEEESKWLQEQLRVGADVIVCFNNAALFGGESDWGHVCLIDSVDEGSVVLIDPELRQLKFRKVEISKLSSAILKHGEVTRGGFWVIQSVS